MQKQNPFNVEKQRLQHTLQALFVGDFYSLYSRSSSAVTMR